MAGPSRMPPAAAGAIAGLWWLVVVAVVPQEPVWLARALPWAGVLVGVWMLLQAARPQLADAAARWKPPTDNAARSPQAAAPGLSWAQPATQAAAAPPPLAHPALAPASATVAGHAPAAFAATQAPRPAPAGSEAVRLGQTADPAFPSWQLHWQLPDGREGVVVLPSGPEVVFGRLEPAAVLADLTEVSRKHMRFAVSANQVAVTELGSSNGTWLRHGQGVWIRLPPGEPMPMQARDQLRIADPWAMVLTLEPVVR